MSKSTKKTKTFEFPEINEELWKDFKAGSLRKDKAREMINDGLKFLIDIQLLLKSSYLQEDAMRKSKQKAKEVDENLEKLEDEYNLIGLVQNLLGRKIEEMTKEENDGDIQTAFNKLEVLALEAHAHGSLREHSKEAVDAIYHKNPGIINSYLVKVNIFNRETRTREIRYFLPDDWRIEPQKYTAWHLRNLQIRTTRRWMEEKGIEPRKRETPVKTKSEPEKDGKPEEKKKVVKKTTKKEKKEKPKKGIAKKGAKAAIKMKAREKTDKAEIQEAKKVKSLADLGELVPNKK